MPLFVGDRAAPWIVFALGCLIAVMVSLAIGGVQRAELEASFSSLANQTIRQLERRMLTYEYGLRGTRGAVVAVGPDRINRTSFRHYIQSRDVEREFPGNRGFAFVRRIAPHQEGALISAMRREGLPVNSVRQLAPHGQDRFVVQYIEPEAPNARAIGLDIASEDRRRETIWSAIGTGNPALTAPITLVQADGRQDRAFLFMLPLFPQHETPASEAQRRKAAIGIINTPLIIDEMLADFRLQQDDLALVISDATEGQAPIRFFSSAADSVQTVPGLNRRITLPIYGRTWLIEVSAMPGFVRKMNHGNRWVVSGGIIVLSAFLALLLQTYLQARHRRAASALDKVRADLSAIVTGSNDAIIGLSPDGEVTSWNSAAERLFGYPEAEAIGHPVTDLIVPEAFSLTERRMIRAVTSGETVTSTEATLHRKDGSPVHVSISLAPIRTPDGETIGIAKTARDISERMRLDREIRLSEQRFKDFTESSADWFWETDAAHRFTFLSDGPLRQLMGPALADWIGKSWREIAQADPLFQFNVWDTHDTLLAQQRPFREVEYCLLDGSGKKAWLSVSGIPFHDPDGRFAGYRGVGQIVTQRRKVTEELQNYRSHLELLVESRTAEAAAAESRMRMIIDSSGAGIIEVDAGGLVRLVNPAACELLGFSPEDLIGRCLHDAIHHSHPDGSHFPVEQCQTAQALVSGGRQAGYEDIFWRADGTPIAVSLSTQPVMSGDVVTGGVLNFIDISARKLALAATEEREEFKTAILDAMQAHVAVLDRDGIIVAVNEPWRRFALENTPQPGIPVSGTGVGANYLQAAGDPAGDTAAQGIRGVLDGRLPSFSLEYACHAPTVKRWFHMYVSPLGKGDKRGVVVSHVEITKRVLAEAQRKLLQYALDQVDIAAYLVNQEGMFEYANGGAVREMGYTKAELLGMGVASIDRSFPIAQWPLFWQDLRNRGKLSVQTTHARKDGGLFPVEIDVHFLNFEDREYALGLARNTTAQRQAQEEQEKARRAAITLARIKSEFLANMSHEIRTPLNGVLGLANIGYRESVGRTQEIFARIGDSGQLLLGIINDILDFSKIEAGKLRIEHIPVSPALVVATAVATLTDPAADKGIALVTDLDSNLPGGFLGDPVRLSQILLNLLSNAVKFTERGEVRLSVRRQAKHLEFSVTDSGIGMTEEQVSRLFHAFEQADGSTTRKYGGTGLGLTISRRLAELMGGDIAVTSTPGRGSTFTLRIPLVVCDPPGDSPRRPAAADSRHRLDGIRILAAEDNEVNQIVLSDILSREGAQATLVGNGRLAVDALQQNPGWFDVVLMDVQMPEMDGLAATRRIREFDTGIPVIGQTAHALAEEHAQCRAAGMNDVVTKPLDGDDVVGAIRGQLGYRSDAAAGAPSAEVDAGGTANGLPAPIDWISLEYQYASRPDFLIKLVEVFIRSNRDRPARIRESARNDHTALAGIAHSLKGNAAFLMGDEVVRLAKAVEQGIVTDSAELAGAAQAAAAAEALAASLESMLSELEAWYASRQP